MQFRSYTLNNGIFSVTYPSSTTAILYLGGYNGDEVYSKSNGKNASAIYWFDQAFDYTNYYQSLEGSYLWGF
jgi:hypothetical protein